MVVYMHGCVIRDVSRGRHRLLNLLGLKTSQRSLLAVSDVEASNAAGHESAVVGLGVEVYGGDGQTDRETRSAFLDAEALGETGFCFGVVVLRVLANLQELRGSIGQPAEWKKITLCLRLS